MQHRKLAAGLLIAGLAAALTTVAPAGATVVDRMREVDEPYTLVFDECQETYGVSFDIAGVFNGRLLLKQGTGPKTETFPVLDNHRIEETWTNAETLRTFSLTSRGVFNEVKARQVSGTVFEFQAVETAHNVIRDEDGALVARNRGAVVYTFLFDTLGDGAPGGDYVSDWDVDARGPQEVEDICALAVELTS